MMKSEGKFEKFAVQWKENIFLRYNILKGLLLVFLVIFVISLLSANAGSDSSVEEIVQKVVPDLVQAQQQDDSGTAAEEQENGAQENGETAGGDEQDEGKETQDEGVFDGMGPATALDFKRIFGLNAEDYEGTAYFKPISQMDVEELLIVKVASDDQMETLEKAVEERIENQKKSFDGYGAAQCALLEKAIVKEKGNFLFYCTSPDAEEYCDRFADAL